MKIRNTSAYPTSEIKQLLAFVKGFPRSQVEVHVKNCRRGTFRGHIYWRANRNPWLQTDKPWLITIGVGAPDKFPHDVEQKFKRAPRYRLENWQECVVAVFAHEVNHLKRFLKHKSVSEVKAEREAFKVLEKVRQTGR